jgi:hypothetical protein
MAYWLNGYPEEFYPPKYVSPDQLLSILKCDVGHA